MRQKETKIKQNSSIRTAVLLLLLVIASFYLFPDMAARFRVGAKAEDGARVAQFAPHAVVEMNQENISYDEATGCYTVPGRIRISNPSEVAVSYQIGVKSAEETTDSESLNGTNFKLNEESRTFEGEAISFTDGRGQLAVGEETASDAWKLWISIDHNTYSRFLTEDGAAFDLNACFQIDITFVQID